MEQGPTRRLPGEASLVVREPPPEQTMAWLLDALDAVEVVQVVPMPGTSTSAMHRVILGFSDGGQAAVVLRRYILEDVLAESPELPSDEVTALRLAASAAVPTPVLLAADVGAERTDVPTVVMSCLTGKPRWEAGDRRRYLQGLSDAMAAVTDVDIPAGTVVRSVSGYTQRSYDPPRWAMQPQVWRRAIEIFHGPVPTGDLCFVHRDFHPGNVLWTRSRLSGLVDWQSAGIGPASIDPGHCRLNMLSYDAHMADQLRTAWEQRTQKSFDPWADVTAIIGTLDSMRSGKNLSRSRLAIEDTLARAVAELSA